MRLVRKLAWFSFWRIAYDIVQEHGGWIDRDQPSRRRMLLHRLPAGGLNSPIVFAPQLRTMKTLEELRRTRSRLFSESVG
jgi:hypothetical protein